VGGSPSSAVVFSFNMSSEPFCALASWNPRGLNMPARRTAVCELATAVSVAILCLQETKLSSIDAATAIEIAGPARRDCFYLPADGTRGGVAIFWNASILSISNPVLRDYSITVSVSILRSGTSFSLTSVYGPSVDEDKPAFLSELVACKPPPAVPWLIVGDFNLIYEARDKNNLNLCRRLMGQIRAAIDSAELLELRCSNRRFSWTNERVDPTMVYLDRIFCNVAWEALFSACGVHALSSSHSDHCPLLLSSLGSPPRKARFRFENFWPRHEGFASTVAEAWVKPVRSLNPFARLRIKLARTARALRFWSRGLFGDARSQLHLVNELILRLDVAQEDRVLSPLEFHLRKALKVRVLGLAAVERARRRQASRVTWLREGDASTRFFHMKMNARRRKNFIHAICSSPGIHTTHESKEAAFFQHF
jgi:exonuclease III